MPINYLIVGGGSAGCVLASRLSENANIHVTLIEAGRDFSPSQTPDDILATYPGRALGNRSYFWKDCRITRGNEAVLGAEGRRRLFYEQACVIGGGSNINGQVALRGTPDDFNRWAALGARGWNWSEVEPYFKRLETDMDFPESEAHGAAGPIRIHRHFRDKWDPFTQAVAQEWEKSQLRYNPDMNGEYEDGFFPIPTSNDGAGRSSAFGVGGKVFEAYFKMLNETQGGINGRKIVVHTLDDGYNPAKTVEQTRRLVEGDEVFAIVATLGTPPNLAISKYLNTKGVPQLLAISGNAELNDGENLPWTTNFFTSQEAEGRIYARYILDENPDAKIAILYQNDDFGRGYLDAFLDELGDKAETMVVAEKSYDLSQPTVDSEVVTLASSGADVFFDITSPKFTAQAIKKAYDIGWTPLHMVLTASTQPSVINSVGAEAANGLLTARYNKAVEDPIYDNDTGVQRYKEFMATYLPDLNFADSSNQLGYGAGALAAQIIEACGDALTRENLIDKATHIEGLQLPLFLDGVTITVTPEDRQPWKASQMARFDGEAWKMFGPVIALDG